MRKLLLISTRPENPLPLRLLLLVNQQTECKTDFVDLSRPNPDYDALLDKIFEADSVQTG